jgi:hypothetical protein
MESDAFGFLPIPRAIIFDRGAAEPLPTLSSDIANVMHQLTHRDGYRYPPQENALAVEVFTPLGGQTERPAHLHQMPSSHVLRLVTRPAETAAPFRLGDGAFLIQFIALIFGYRLQFESWWFDGRLPMFPRRWRLPLQSDQDSRLLSAAYSAWRGWPSRERVRFTNLVYMHVRSATYGWDWERFTINYMVLDGCYKMALRLNLVPEIRRHRERLAGMLQAFGMPIHADAAKIVAFRNDLFHEALWDGGQPGTGSRIGPKYADHLSRINDRFLFALTGYRGPYLTADWSSIGPAPM